jgi:hypothetical protein
LQNNTLNAEPLDLELKIYAGGSFSLNKTTEKRSNSRAKTKILRGIGPTKLKIKIILGSCHGVYRGHE